MSLEKQQFNKQSPYPAFKQRQHPQLGLHAIACERCALARHFSCLPNNRLIVTPQNIANDVTRIMQGGSLN